MSKIFDFMEQLKKLRNYIIQKSAAVCQKFDFSMENIEAKQKLQNVQFKVHLS